MSVEVHPHYSVVLERKQEEWKQKSRQEIRREFKELAANVIAGNSPVPPHGLLMCYRTYCSSSELFNVWLEQFAKYEKFEELGFEDEIHLKVISNFLCEWMGKYSIDFGPLIFKKVVNMVLRLPVESRTKMKLLILKNSSIIRGTLPRRFSFFGKIAPKPQQLLRIQFGSILELPSLEAAKALTEAEYNIFHQINPMELLDQKWQKATKEIEAPTITALIERFNQVSYWVASQVILAKKKKQSQVVERFIRIAEHCERFNNFNSLMEILSGLNNMSLVRLDYLWKGVSKKMKKKFADLELMMHARCNFRGYRNTLVNRSLPILPYFAVYLKDVTFLTTTHKETEFSSPNEEFLKKWGVLVGALIYFQSQPYEFDIQQNARRWLIDSQLYYLDDDSMYEHSVRHLKSKLMDEDSSEDSFGTYEYPSSSSYGSFGSSGMIEDGKEERVERSSSGKSLKNLSIPKLFKSKSI